MSNGKLTDIKIKGLKPGPKPAKYPKKLAFVAQLEDKRTLVVEYKGAHLVGSPDTEEKQNIGELWAEESKGQCLFLMAENKDKKGRTVDKQLSAVIG